MKNILFLTTTPTVGGNGDTLIAAAMDEAAACGAGASLIHIRERQIGFCQACYGCAETGVCVQKDDFMATTVFYDESYITSTDIGKTEFPYDRNIDLLAETKDYFVFVFDKSHAQVYDKHALSGGTIEEFRGFITEKTGKEITNVV